MNVDRFNALTDDQAREELTLCCVSQRWIDGMLGGRPFADREALARHADRVWRSLDESDYLEAFEGHPQIGNVATLRRRYAASESLATGEQSGVAAANDELLARLADGNRRYLERFGFIFIVCATGKTAEEMCQLLESRLPHERDRELVIAAEEQRKILQLRLEKLP